MTRALLRCGGLALLALLAIGVPGLAGTGAAASGASPLELRLPLACRPGADCWVLNHVDLDPGPGRRDYACGRMAVDGHKGTDIALAHAGRLVADVPVLAAAAGEVVSARDGVADANVRETGVESVKGRECGNGVRLAHDGGWVTQYCHMRRGSVRVRPGQKVEVGDRIGSVGMSGMSEFAHVHLLVERDGRVVDPFRGVAGGPDCGIGDVPLWQPAVLAGLRQDRPFVYNSGFTDHVPEAAAVRRGRHRAGELPADVPAIVFWAEVGGLRAGDRITTRLLDPSGAIQAEKAERIEQHRIRIYRAIGRRARALWPAGIWRGEVIVDRAGRPPARREFRLTVE